MLWNYRRRMQRLQQPAATTAALQAQIDFLRQRLRMLEGERARVSRPAERALRMWFVQFGCTVCRRKLSDQRRVFGHIRAVCDHGDSRLTNLMPSCDDCNENKTEADRALRNSASDSYPRDPRESWMVAEAQRLEALWQRERERKNGTASARTERTTPSLPWPEFPLSAN